MNIGIDLDNTLINYDDAFLASAQFLSVNLPKGVTGKNQISRWVRSQQDGENCWQKLQGLAYGRFLKSHAKLYPGAKRFLLHSRLRGDSVTVVSHKTEYAHFDSEKIMLREAALEFLSQKGLGELKVFFETTHHKKIDRIIESSFSWFIDDLQEVISDLKKRAKLHLICFGVDLINWQQIDNLIYGEWSVSEIIQLTSQVMNKEFEFAEKNLLGSNSAVYQVDNLKLKIYPADLSQDRLGTEFGALRFLSESGIKTISRPIVQDIDLGVGIYEWIEGQPVTAPTLSDVQQCVQFLGQLHSIRNKIEYQAIPTASASCLSGLDIERQIRHRANQYGSELSFLFEDRFQLIAEKLISWSQNHWRSKIDYETPLPEERQILSPSDFGFHNAIKKSDGSIAFIDFEYFGWDDPAKLISDFVLHPAAQLSSELESYWLEQIAEIYGPDSIERHICSRPLYGLIWCLILLGPKYRRTEKALWLLESLEQQY